jgi:hypothetical protein
VPHSDLIFKVYQWKIFPSEQSPAQPSRLRGALLRRLVRGRASFNQLITVALLFFFGCFLAKLGQAFEQIRELGFVPGFSDCLNQMVNRRLILRIYAQGFFALLDGLAILPSLQTKLRQKIVSGAQTGL